MGGGVIDMFIISRDKIRYEAEDLFRELRKAQSYGYNVRIYKMDDFDEMDWSKKNVWGIIRNCRNNNFNPDDKFFEIDKHGDIYSYNDRKVLKRLKGIEKEIKDYIEEVERLTFSFELKDTNKEVQLRIIDTYEDESSEELLHLYTQYLIKELKYYHENIENIDTLNDVLAVLGRLGIKTEGNEIAFHLNVWGIKKEFYNVFNNDNYIIDYDSDRDVDLHRHEYWGHSLLSYEFSIENNI